MEAIFLCENVEQAEFFVGFVENESVDIWEVDATGVATEHGRVE
jgi:hypothetical protein